MHKQRRKVRPCSSHGLDISTKPAFISFTTCCRLLAISKLSSKILHSYCADRSFRRGYVIQKLYSRAPWGDCGAYLFSPNLISVGYSLDSLRHNSVYSIQWRLIPSRRLIDSSLVWEGVYQGIFVRFKHESLWGIGLVYQSQGLCDDVTYPPIYKLQCLESTFGYDLRISIYCGGIMLTLYVNPPSWRVMCICLLLRLNLAIAYCFTLQSKRRLSWILLAKLCWLRVFGIWSLYVLY